MQFESPFLLIQLNFVCNWGGNYGYSGQIHPNFVYCVKTVLLYGHYGRNGQLTLTRKPVHHNCDSCIICLGGKYLSFIKSHFRVENIT